MKKIVLLHVLFSVAFLAWNAHATNDDKLIEKARTAVAIAEPGDWFTLASWAEKCIKKGVNLKEAGEWVEKSIAIRETAFNVSVKGDYYVAIKENEKALEAYLRSLELVSAEDEFDVAAVQSKIAKLSASKK